MITGCCQVPLDPSDLRDLADFLGNGCDQYFRKLPFLVDTEQKIFSILKDVEAGVTIKDVCRRHGLCPATFYQWKSKYCGLKAFDLKRLKDLEQENSRLKQLYAETAIENKALKDLIHRKL